MRVIRGNKAKCLSSTTVCHHCLTEYRREKNTEDIVWKTSRISKLDDNNEKDNDDENDDDDNENVKRGGGCMATQERVR